MPSIRITYRLFRIYNSDACTSYVFFELGSAFCSVSSKKKYKRKRFASRNTETRHKGIRYGLLSIWNQSEYARKPPKPQPIITPKCQARLRELIPTAYVSAVVISDITIRTMGDKTVNAPNTNLIAHNYHRLTATAYNITSTA